MKVSIISTVYNKEKFLIEHINSLIRQDYKNIEFIFINDGSTDDSLEILKEYQNKDKRINIINQNNQGPSIARKNGFIKSTGNLIYFVDSDDTLYNCYVISDIIKIFNEYKDIDFVIGQMYNSYNNVDILDKIIYTENIEKGIYDISYLYDKSFRLSLCNKIVKRDRVKEEDFLSSRVFEDAVLTYEIYSRSKKFYYYNEPIYVVNRKNENSGRITATLNLDKIKEKYKNLKIIEKNSRFDISIKRLYLQCYLDDLNYSLKFKYKEKVEFINLINKFFSKQNFNKNYLINNKHYKQIYRFRKFLNKPFLNFLIYYIIAIKKVLLVIKRFFFKIFKKIVLFFPIIFIKFFKKLKINFYKIKYGKRLSIGKNFNFRKNFIINISKTGNLKIGDNNFFNNYCTINCQNNIMLGNDNIFGENVKFYDHDHLFNDLSKDIKSNFNKGKIIIGNDNWIGTNSVVLRDTYLGNKNVIGAGVILKGKYDSNKLIKSDRKIVVEDITYKK